MKYLILALALSFVCSCKQTNDKNIQLVTVDVAKDYPPKEVWLQDIAEMVRTGLSQPCHKQLRDGPEVHQHYSCPLRLRPDRTECLAEAYANNQITDEKLKEIASNLKEEDNPVLMILKFKN